MRHFLYRHGDLASISLPMSFKYLSLYHETACMESYLVVIPIMLPYYSTGEKLSCPLMFRCRYDNICIHPHNVCDGVVHCRHSHDDESLCEAKCPYRCTCTGLTAVCNSTTHKRTHHHYPLLGLKVAETRVDFGDLIHSCTTLLILYIEHTVVTIVDLTAINNNQMLYILTLNDNNLHRFHSNSFNKLSHLHQLDVRQNYIPVLESNAFGGMHNLQIYNMSGLAVRKLENCCVCGMSTLHTIDLSNNNIKVLHRGMLLTTNPVDVINLSNNNITFIQQSIFKTYFRHVIFTEPAHLCFSVASQTDLVVKQSPHLCEQLLTNNTFLSIFISLTVFLLIINVSVILQHISNKVHYIFILHLAFADMFCVFYLTTIASAQLYYGEQFPLHRQHWMLSTPCQASMVLFIISLCQSKCITFFINLNYLLGTKYVMKRRPFSKTKAYTILLCLWATTLLLSALFGIFTANTSLFCLQPTTLLVHRKLYILEIGYAVHLLLSFTNISLTTYTYLSIIQSIQTSARKTNKKADTRVQVRVLLVKAAIIIVPSLLCDSCLASLPFTNTDTLRKIEIYMVLIATPQKIIADAIVYTYMNRIRQLVHLFGT